MTDLLCQWLNNDVKLQEIIAPETFAMQFSSGYLLGEIMSIHGLQDDFKSFSPGKTTDAKLNNFSRLEPSLRLLQVPFNSNVVCDVMREKPGTATRLMYQLYIALNKKVQQNLTSHAMEAMKSTEKMKHEMANADIYQKRLRQKIPRQIEVDLEELVKVYKKKRLDNLEKALALESRRSEKAKKETISKLTEERKKLTLRQRQLISEKITKTPPQTRLIDIKTKKKEQKTKVSGNKVAKNVMNQLDTFEANMTGTKIYRNISLMNTFSNFVKGEGVEVPAIGSHENRKSLLNRQDNADYISKIRMKLCDDALARKEREKRRRRVLIEQLSAQDAIEQAKHEELLVTCLMRQSQFERRIANQLLNVRAEKDVIKNNRLRREKQYMERRMKDFDEALDYERNMAQMIEKENEEKIEKEKAIHAKMARKHRQDKYLKHYDICKDILNEILNLSCKVGYYREISEGPILYQHWQEFKSMFVHGIPFYEVRDGVSFSTTEIKDEVIEILNDSNMTQYHELRGEWKIDNPEIQSFIEGRDNLILGHILKRLSDIVYCPPPKPAPPQFPNFPIKACLLGKTQAGKTAVLEVLSNKLGFVVLDPDVLVAKAVQAYRENETHQITEVVESKVEVPQDAEKSVDVSKDKIEVKADPNAQEVQKKEQEKFTDGQTIEKMQTDEKLTSPSLSLKTIAVEVSTPRALLGKEIEAALTKGKPIPTNSLVNVIIEEIHKLPESSGWVLDNFPKTLRQAKFLEKALTGFSSHDGRSSSQSHMSAGSTPRNTPSPLKFNKGRKGKKNQLVAEPASDKAQPSPVPVSGVDLVIHLAVSDKEAITRACKKVEATDSDTKNTEMATKHKLIPFNEEWNKIEGWFEMFNNFMTIDAEKSVEDVISSVEDTMKTSLLKKENAETKEATETAPPAEVLVVPQETDTAAETPTEILLEPVEPKLPAPGSADYEYINEPVPAEVAKMIYPEWETVEDAYISVCKTTFEKIREERENFYHYFFKTKKNFKMYLERPDNKQTFVQNWVKTYNDVPEDLRGDVDMKCELHQTVEDLKEQLWDISDKKKAAAEEERRNIMTELWIEDHCGLLINNFIELMQAEVDRYQGSVQLLRDYYVIMENKIPEEMMREFVRVSLVDIPRTETQIMESKSAASIDRNKSNTSSASPTPPIEEDGEPERKIPLVPRKTFRRSAKKDRDRDTPEQDPEESQIVEAYVFAIGLIDALKIPNPEDEQQETGKGKSKAKDKKGKKKGSAKSTPNAASPAVELSPEEIEKQKLLGKTRLECTAALLCEDKHFNLRLALIKHRALSSIKELKDKAACMYELLDQWIGERFNREMESIGVMCEMLRDLIESEKIILPQLLLQGDAFLIDKGHHITEPPVSPPPDEPIELSKPDQFTIHQIQTLHRSLKEMAPQGHISTELLIDLFSSGECLPEAWLNMSYAHIESMVSKHMFDSKYINCASVVFSAMYPLPMPSKVELLEALSQFKGIDRDGTGKIDMSSYAQTMLWFGSDLPVGPAEFHREGNLKVLIFTLFCDEDFFLDYFYVLLMFCHDFSPIEGLMKGSDFDHRRGRKLGRARDK